MNPLVAVREMLRRRRAEARAIVRSTNFEAFADIGSEANRRLMAIVVGWMFLGGAIIGMVAVLPYTGRLGIPFPVVLVSGVVILALGLLLLSLSDRVPMWGLDAISGASAVFISMALWVLDEQQGGYAILFYLWPMVAVTTLRSYRATLFHFAWIAFAALPVFSLDDTFSSRWFWWGVVVLALGTVWHTVGWLVRRARRLAVRERRARRRAEAASSALGAVSEQKSRFLARMSHELRTPLNAVIGFGQMLRRQSGGALNSRQREYVDDIVDSGEHLLSLIDDTLDAAKVESGNRELKSENILISGVVEDATRLVRGRAARAGIDLHVEVEPAVSIVCDPRKVKQVLVNLLSNAVKFTPPDGSVTVTAGRGPGGAVFSVSDDGPGIDPAHHDSIFEEFHQTEDASRVGEGTGLGLAVARELVELHGGRIWVQSSVGAGARFLFSIPEAASRETAPTDEADARPHRGRRWSKDVLSAHNLMGRGAVFVAYTGAGGLLGAFFVDTPGVEKAQFWGAVGLSVGLLIAIWFAFQRLEDRDILRAGLALLCVAGIATSVGVYELGPLAATTAIVWVGEAFLVRFIGIRLGVRAGWVYVSFVAVVFAVILALQPGNDSPFAQWLLVVTSVWVGSFVAGWLLGAVEILAAAEQRAADTAIRAAAELDTVTRHKSQFLASMSHELRTPLNAVIGFAEMLEREVPGPLTPRQRVYVDDIIDSGRSLLTLINDVLDLAKIDAGRFEIHPESVDVGMMVRAASRKARELAHEKNVSFAIDVETGVVVVADGRRLGQAVAGLTANAVKFTPPGGSVAVSSGRADDGVRVVVTDTGPGVAPGDHDAVFEAFHQVDVDPTRSSEGAGLGLALARRLIEMHGGSLALDSALGEGATFTVTLPGEPSPSSDTREAVPAVVTEGHP